VTPKGAGAIRSYAMARKLIMRGHSVTMVCGSAVGGTTGLTAEFVNGLRRDLVDGIDVIELDLSYSNSDGFARRIKLFLKFALRSIQIAITEPCDLVFATTTPLTAGLPGIFAKWFRSKPFVFEVRDLWPELPRAMGVITNPVMLWAMGVLEWISYRSADRLIGLSPGIVEGIHQRGIALEKIVMIPNGCDLDIFSADETPWRPADINDEDLLAVYAGTHGIANGLQSVLDAAQELKRRGRDDIKILLIGSGKLKQELRNTAFSNGLDNVFFHEPVTKTRLSGLMKSTDIGLQILANVPSFYFGTSPNKFFDYIAAGVPVLNNYPGWLSEMIKAANCGLAVPPNDPIAFADALQYAADHRDELRSMGKRASELAIGKFDRVQLANTFVDWLEQVLKQKAPK
jgi:glycosyltransferase involved in cell wall biosynthesis